MYRPLNIKKDKGQPLRISPYVIEFQLLYSCHFCSACNEKLEFCLAYFPSFMCSLVLSFTLQPAPWSCPSFSPPVTWPCSPPVPWSLNKHSEVTQVATDRSRNNSDQLASSPGGKNSQKITKIASKLRVSSTCESKDDL